MTKIKKLKKIVITITLVLMLILIILSNQTNILIRL